MYVTRFTLYSKNVQIHRCLSILSFLLSQKVHRVREDTWASSSLGGPRAHKEEAQDHPKDLKVFLQTYLGQGGHFSWNIFLISDIYTTFGNACNCKCLSICKYFQNNKIKCILDRKTQQNIWNIIYNGSNTIICLIFKTKLSTIMELSLAPWVPWDQCFCKTAMKQNNYLQGDF